MNKIIIKNIILFCCLFGLLYVENYSISGVKLTFAWKGVLIAYLVFRLLKAQNYSITSVVALGLLFVVKLLIYDYSVARDYSAEVLYAIKMLSFLLLIEYFILISNNDKLETLDDYAVKFSCGLILVCVPFLLGILDPPINEDKFSLAKFGYANVFEFVGSYGGKHNAAVTLAAALIVLVTNITKTKYLQYRNVLLVIIIIGVFALYKTYVRTGFLAFFGGLTIIYFSVGDIRGKLSKIPLILTVLLCCYFLFMNSEIVQMRILDKSIYDDVGMIGSGRLVFYTVGIESFLHGDIIQILLGVGDGRAKELMASHVGQGYASHSGFLDILRISGLIGLFLFFAMLNCIYRIIKKNSFEKSSTLLGLLVAYIAVMTVQGGFYFWLMFLFAIYIAKGFLEINKKGKV